MKLWKVYRRTDRQTTDDRWSEKLTWAFSSGELKTHNLPSENWVKTWIHFIHQYFVPDLVVISPVVLKGSFGISSMYFFKILLSPIRKRCGPSFEQSWIPFIQKYFVQCLVEISPLVLKNKEMWKVNRRSDRQLAIRKAHLSFQLRWHENRSKF